MLPVKLAVMFVVQRGFQRRLTIVNAADSGNIAKYC